MARRRSWTVPLIIVVALVLATVGFLGQKPVPPPPPVEPTPTPEPVALDWTAIPLDPEAFRGAIVGLVSNGPGGLVAFGQNRTNRDPITWTSADGRVWVRHDQPARTFGGGVPDLAAQVGSSYVAVGYRATADGVTRDIWTSPDGVAWIRDPSRSGQGFDEIRALASTGGTAILVGSTGGRQVLQASADGRLWTATSGFDAGLDRDPYVADAIEWGGGYIAVGSIGSTSAIWRSADGRTWAQATPTDLPALDTIRFDRVVRTTAGLLATGGSERFGNVSTWVSQDGLTWTQDTTSTVGLPQLAAVYVLDGADVGVPNDLAQGGSGDLTVWTDPVTPFSTPGPAMAPTDWMKQATVVDGRILLLAQDANGDAVDGWLGTVVGSGAVRASPTPAATAASDGSAPPSRPPIPSPTPLVVQPRTPTGAPIEWARLTSRPVLSDDVRDVSMAGVVQVGSGLIAYGSEGTDAAIWRASDTGGWERMPVSASMRGGLVRAVAQAPGRLVAVGAVQGPDGQESPAAWTSPDGRSWVRSTIALAQGTGEMSDVVAGPDGLVAVGWLDSNQGTAAMVWISPNGSSWGSVLSLRAATPGMMTAIAHGEAGYVAVGTSQPQESSAVGAAWVSPDGRTWTRDEDQVAFQPSVDDASRFGGMSVSDVAAGGPGFVAVGSQDGPTGPVGTIYTSRDGRSWTRLPSDPMFDGAYLLNVVPWAGGGFAAAGDLSDYAGSSPVIYASPDGIAWAPIARAELDAGGPGDPGDTSLAGITEFGPDLVGVGSSGGYAARRQGEIWVGARLGEVVPDHVCPAKVETLVVLASMTSADRAGCLLNGSVTVEAMVRGSDGGCTADIPEELSGCGGNLDLAPVEGGPSLFTTPVDRTILAPFPSSTFARFALTFTAGSAGPECVPPVSYNGVIYPPLESTRLQCLGVLRLVKWVPIARP